MPNCKRLKDWKKSVEAAEINSDKAKQNTDPEKTWEQGIKLMWHSVVWSTIASTLCGVGVGAIITHYSTKERETKQEPKKEVRIERVIEREVLPDGLVLRDASGKIAYTVDVAPKKESSSDNGSIQSPSDDSVRPKAMKPKKKKIKALKVAPR